MRAEADPALFARWARGWTMTRGLAPPVAVAGGWRVDSVKPDHRWRFLYPGIDPAIAERARQPMEAPFHLKVAASADRVRPLLPAGWTIDDSTAMMTRRGGNGAMPILPTGYRLNHHAPAPDVTRIEIVDSDGGPAASGWMTRVNDMAIFDRIATDPAHRRQGLGRAIMTALGLATEAAAASIWMLAATTEGAALYATLGWERHSPYLTAMPPIRAG